MSRRTGSLGISEEHRELHRLAKGYMRQERPDHLLQTTALINEAYLRLIDWKHVQWQNRAHFFGVAAQLMRRILVDFARARQQDKRGGAARQVSLDEAAAVSVGQSAEFIALDEAFVNAVKHGNKNDLTKLVKITAELSEKEASFTVEDEGEGFNIQEIPDPCDPANLFHTSGRGVLLIYNIMDEVEYNAQGNRVKMVKRPDGPVEAQLVDPNTPDDKHA